MSRCDWAWWATGLGLVPLIMAGIVLFYAALFGVAFVLALLAGVAEPGSAFTWSGDYNLFVGAFFVVLIGIISVGPLYLVLGVLLLAALRSLAHRGWTQRRLRCLAVITGIVATAPLYPFIPAGAFYGFILPLPDAPPERRRRVLSRTCAGLAALTVMLAPLSLLGG